MPDSEPSSMISVTAYMAGDEARTAEAEARETGAWKAEVRAQKETRRVDCEARGGWEAHAG